VSDTALLIFCKPPIPGQAKTRLKPLLGFRGAARAQANLANQRLTTLIGFPADIYLLAADGPARHPFFLHWRRQPPFQLRRQRRGNLGQRMHQAAKQALNDHEQVILLGTDCPALTQSHIASACQALITQDAVMIPATDGGYVLLGCKQAAPNLFRLPRWGDKHVAKRTRQRLRRLSWRWQELSALADLDTPSDWRAARRSGLIT